MPNAAQASGASMDRQIYDCFSEPLVLFPYTSIACMQSGTNDFDAVVPLVDGEDPELGSVSYIPSWAMAMLDGRYVYLLQDSKALAQGFRDNVHPFFQDAWSYDQTGKFLEELEGSPFVLTNMIMVEGGVGAVVYYQEKVASLRWDVDAGKVPLKSPPALQDFRLRLFDNHGIWAFSSPYPLSAPQIAALEESNWLEFPPEPFGPDAFVYWVAITAPAVGTGGESKYRSGMAVVDPLIILEDLTKKYELACDRYIAHTADVETKNELFPDSEEREIGRNNLMRRDIGRIVQGMADAKPRVAGEIKGGLARIQEFEKAHSDFLNELYNEREIAAQNLMAWLESGPMAFLDDACRDGGGKPIKDRSAEYVKACCVAVRRMHETEEGARRLADAVDRAQREKKSGLIRILSEYVLPERKPEAEWTGVNREVAMSVYEASKCCLLVVQQMLAAGHEFKSLKIAGSTLSEKASSATRLFLAYFNHLFGEDFMELVERDAELRALKDLGKEKIHQFRISKYPAALNGALSAAKESSGVAINAVNVVLTLMAVEDAKKEGASRAAQAEANANFVEAYVGLAEELAEIYGKKGAARALGVVGGIAGILAGVAGARDKYDMRNFDGMAGEVAEGVGAAVSLYGTYLMLASGESGPAAGWFLLGGAILSGGGAAWSFYFTDSAYEQFAKFGEFGVEKGASVPADPWAYVDNFREWTPPQNTVSKGLELQLAAAQQLYHGFTVEGVDGSPGTIRITPAKLTSRSSFHIKWRAFYFKDYPQDGEVAALDAAQFDGYVRLDVKDPFSVADGGKIEDAKPGLESLGQVKVITEGKVRSADGAFDVTLEIDMDPKANTFDVRSAFEHNPKLLHLECLVRLDVMGDGKLEGAKGSVVVPRVDDGWVWLVPYTSIVIPNKHARSPSFGSSIRRSVQLRSDLL